MNALTLTAIKKSRMLKVKLLIAILICSCVQASAQESMSTDEFPEIPQEDLINKPFPTFKLSSDGVLLTNESLMGKVVYVNFWFKACYPCMKEMPAINELFEKFKNDTNFVLISITYDSLPQIEMVKEKFQIAYKVFSVTFPEFIRLNRTHTFPANIILNKNGVIEFYETGNTGVGFLIDRYFKRKIYSKIEKLLNGADKSIAASEAGH
jgi:thiol-disulfide isomerase/thioredoxin